MNSGACYLKWKHIKYIMQRPTAKKWNNFYNHIINVLKNYSMSDWIAGIFMLFYYYYRIYISIFRILFVVVLIHIVFLGRLLTGNSHNVNVSWLYINILFFRLYGLFREQRANKLIIQVDYLKFALISIESQSIVYLRSDNHCKI